MPQQLFERFLVFLLLLSHLNSSWPFPQLPSFTGAEIRIAGTVSCRDDKPGVDQGAATQVCHEHHGNLWKEVLAMITTRHDTIQGRCSFDASPPTTRVCFFPRFFSLLDSVRLDKLHSASSLNALQPW